MATDFICKIVTLGESNVGKSSILLRYTKDLFYDTMLHTVGLDFCHKIVSFHGKKTKLLLYDTAGQERFRNVVSQYYRSADGILLIYDIGDLDSFNKIQHWIEKIMTKSDTSKHIIYLIGNKCDSNDKVVSTKQGIDFALKYDIKFFEISAKGNINIEEMFKELIRDIHSKIYIEGDSEARTNADQSFNLDQMQSDQEQSKTKFKCCL